MDVAGRCDGPFGGRVPEPLSQPRRVLKTPQIDYSDYEVRAIREFVHRGGGLLAIGDHTNLFSANVRLNRLTADAGILVRDDSVRNAEDLYFVTVRPSPLRRHPTIARTDELTFMTGCSVWAGRASDVAMAATDVVTDPADYINSSYFPSWSADGETACGRVGVLAAARYGEGRIVVSTDGTPLSSFDYYKGDYADTVLSIVEWLNRENGGDALAWTLAALGTALVVAAAVRTPARALWTTSTLAAATLGVYAGQLASGAAARAWYPEPKEFAAPPQAAFVTWGCHAAFPASLGDPGPIEPTALFDTLYNLPLRLGRRVRSCRTIVDAVDANVATIAWVNAVVEPAPDEISQLARWIESGGKLVVIQSSRMYRSPAMDAVASGLGMTLELNADRTPRIPEGRTVPSPAGVMTFRVDRGSGSATFVVSDDAFCNQSVGHSMSVPTARQLELYKFVFSLFRYEGPRFDYCRVVR